MAKFNSSDILKILRKFKIASDNHVPRNIEELKKSTPDEFSEIFSFKFLGDKFLVINDGTAEDNEFYILDLLRQNYGELEGKIIENPQDDFASFAMPFEGKDIYLFRVIPSKIRLDIALKEKYPELSRASIQKYIKNGFVKINNSLADKPRILVSREDEISLNIPEKSSE